MNLNIHEENRNKFILCTNCNKEISLLDYTSHKDKCYFRQTFHKSHNRHIDKENVVRVDPNYSSLSSLKTIKIDKLEKNKEDNYKRDLGYFNMNDAIVTFGAKKYRKSMPDEVKSEIKNKNEYDEIDQNVVNVSNNPSDHKLFGIENKLNDNNSYLNVNIQVLWSMRKIRTHIMNIKINSNDGKNQILQNLQKVFLKIENSPKPGIFSITELRKSIAESFQSRRKFLMNYPDDPIDLYFALINSLHSFYIKSHLNEIKDTSCDLYCAAHKYLFLDISRKDICECKGSSKRLYSYHNYIFEIPLKRILNSYNESSFDNEKVYSMMGNLFIFYKNLILNIKANCPEKGSRCSVNKTKKAYFLHSSPEYICFNLQEHSSNKNLIEILKTIIIIPKYFNLSNIFYKFNKETSSDYELLGLVCVTLNKNYTCINKHGNSWFYFEDERITNLSSWNEVTSLMLKKVEVPIMIYYEKKENISRDMDYLSKEDIEGMISYCGNMSRIGSIFENKFRPNEDLFNFEDENGNEYSNIESKKEKENGIILSKNDKNKINQCDICGLKIIHSDNSNFTCFCNGKRRAGNSEILNEQSKTTIDSKRQLKKNPSKSIIKIEDKNTPSTPSPTVSEKEKIRKNVSENLQKINLSKESYNYIQEKPTSSGSSHEEIAVDKKEINLPKHMINRHILIQDDSNLKKRNQPIEETKIDEKWTCIVCSTINKIKNYKCSKCNNKNYEILERICKKDPHKQNEKIPIKEDKFIFKNIMEKVKIISEKNTPKNQNKIQIDKKETKSNFLQKELKAKIAKTESLCICHKLDEDKKDTLFNNNLCRICGRIRFDSLQPDEFHKNKYKSTELRQNQKLSNQEDLKISKDTKIKNEKALKNNYISLSKQKLKINTKTDSKSYSVLNHREKIIREGHESEFNNNKIGIMGDFSSMINNLNKNSKILSPNNQHITNLNKKIQNFGNVNIREHLSKLKF